MSSTDFNWDEFESNGEFPDPFKFRSVGDSVAGTITNIRVTDFGGTGTKTPELWIKPDEGDEVSVAAGQTVLRQKLAAERPRVGDRIAIVYTGDGTSKKAGFTPPKQFDVVVKRGDAAKTAEVAEPGDGEKVSTSAVSAADLV